MLPALGGHVKPEGSFPRRWSGWVNCSTAYYVVGSLDNKDLTSWLYCEGPSRSRTRAQTNPLPNRRFGAKPFKGLAKPPGFTSLRTGPAGPVQLL
jgi:hypothetical protein